MIFSLSTDDSLKCVLITNIREKIKAINNKIKLNKAQGNLGRQTGNISPLSWGGVNKCEVLTVKDLSPVKDLLEKAASFMRFEFTIR